MQTLIPNRWEPLSDLIHVAKILRHDRHPEGLDVDRVRFSGTASYQLPRDSGTLLSVLSGGLRLTVGDDSLAIGASTHVYLPPRSNANLEGQAGTEIVYACAPSSEQAPGTRLLVRSDRFIASCALPGRSLRWILTPQYLSRRAFLHHDKTLLGPNGTPLSWFHTTMFDARGLPPNEDGQSVFKMSYNYRTEPNVCYDVAGRARFRVASHPYESPQGWNPWEEITAESTYHLCETADLAEWVEEEGQQRPRRNKHEVQIEDGHVSLICMHNPGCTGAEQHAEGEYSEYGNPEDVIGTKAHREHLEQIAPLDAVVDTLSLAEARGVAPESLPEWSQHQTGLANQRAVEAILLRRLQDEGEGREQILESWVL